MEFINKLSKNLDSAGEIDYLLVIISLFFCLITSFILMNVYKHKANSLSSKYQISNIIPLLANITFLVILIVKSSLALSLGLVGALSVIRFRTPVKEPEDLVFLFFSIALGIGYGALQIYPTTIIFVILIVIIWYFLSKSKEDFSKSFNLVVECNLEKNQDYFDNILATIKENSDEAQMVKVEKDENVTMLFYKISFNKIENMKSLITNLENSFKEIKFSLYEVKSID
ncbi:DUF4956 domain-containing protein [Candidatus Pelagibacter bacterium nBUS_32]|uniref:DUF4956 domain-containing protein n=1 Tax=Candidatus Pelagibacter bacterium nBUS_32 TaxID=3374192 RepID=UPI003EB7F9EC